MASLPRVFNIPASAPFLKVLVDALLDGKIIDGFAPRGDPLALATATIYLPTRRACRALRDAFLDALGEAAILPRIVPIGDVDEDEIAFANAATGASAETALQLPEALSSLDRKLLLAQLIATWAKSQGARASEGAPLVANTPAATLDLADALARLIDDMATRRVPWDRIKTLVPDDLGVYWQKTLEFLDIAIRQWPDILRDLQRIEAVERRDKLIAAEIARLAAGKAPVIAAGSTGSMPATADLLAAIAKLPHGAVVLPGLDTDLEDDAWDMLNGDADGKMASPAHPQFAMQALLKRIGILRRDVMPLAASAPHGREAYVSQALRPAETTDRWAAWLSQPDAKRHREQALSSLTLIEAPTAEDEALAIAVALREILETPGKTAALITPDRALARRVLAALERWRVDIDDSGGDDLADTPAGVFARLAAQVALGGTEPVPLLALLKHSLFRLGDRAEAHGDTIEWLEIALLRGPRPKRGMKGLAAALKTLRHSIESGEKQRGPRARLTAQHLDDVEKLIARIAQALAPLETLVETSGDRPAAFADLAARHRQCVVALSADADGVIAALQAHGGRELSRAFDEIAATDHASGFALRPADYAEMFAAAVAGRIVRKPELPGVRLRVYGPLEARLQQVDRVVLGGLNEGIWPPETRSDVWLSRPMRRELGLDAPERRIGLAAHDFAQALGAPEIFLSRAAKTGGAPTVMSRFLQRLAALADSGWNAARERGERYVAWAQNLDEPKGEPDPVKQPAPSPLRTQRPSRLSVTEIEHWLRDPYTIYAKHILRVRPLDAVDEPPGYADRGTLMHNAVGDFTQAFARDLPKDAVEKLIDFGGKHFLPMQDFPEAKAFWWPRFVRIASWFVDWETKRRIGIETVIAEQEGRIPIERESGPFELTTRADRIERLRDGRFRIVDYKTGAPPTTPQVISGLAPQLSLEAAVLRRGGFDDIAEGGSVDALIYVRLRGGRPAGVEEAIKIKDGTADALADEALAKLTELVRRFDSDTQPYRSMISPMWKASYGDYDHLARIKEWSVQPDEDEFG